MEPKVLLSQINVSFFKKSSKGRNGSDHVPERMCKCFYFISVFIFASEHQSYKCGLLLMPCCLFVTATKCRDNLHMRSVEFFSLLYCCGVPFCSGTTLIYLFTSDFHPRCSFSGGEAVLGEVFCTYRGTGRKY